MRSDGLAKSLGTPFATITADFDQSGINTIGIRDRLANWVSFDKIRFATSFAGAMGATPPATYQLVIRGFRFTNLAIFDAGGSLFLAQEWR